jgi:hypothetical protein
MFNHRLKAMRNDPIVEEIRKIRDSYAAEFNYDIQAIYEDIKKQEKASKKPHHCLTPKAITLVINHEH